MPTPQAPKKKISPAKCGREHSVLRQATAAKTRDVHCGPKPALSAEQIISPMPGSEEDGKPLAKDAR
jgi:hypothetical protein